MPVLVIRIPDDETDLASDYLWSLGATAIEERPHEDSSITLIAGFSDEDEALGARSVLSERWGTRYEADPDDREWRDVWLKHLEPIEVGRLCIHPPWRPCPQRAAGHDASLAVSIDPGHAFGSGHHPTTRLVLAEISARIKGGERVLDVGCGTGVLSIAAVICGAGEAIGIDLDHDIIDTAVGNAEDNAVDDNTQFSTLSLSEIDPRSAGTFDVVLANITLGELRPLLPALCERTDGLLIVSGMLAEQQVEVAELTQGQLVSSSELEGWAALVFSVSGANR